MSLLEVFYYKIKIFRLKVIFTKEFIVSNNFNGINNIWTIIKNNQVENKDLIFRFNEDYYDISLNKEFTNEINIISNVSFIGNINGTIFDYNRLRKGTFRNNDQPLLSLNMECVYSSIYSIIVISNTSAIFNGNTSNYEISDSIFHNVTLKKSIPAIFNSKVSYFHINNTEFKNLNLISGIWESESSYYLYNVNFIDIKTNSKALLHIVGKDVYFTNVTAENISCVGDGGNTSMILFDSNNIDDFKKFHIYGLNVTNSFSNGPLIKTIGNYIEMILDDSDSNINKIKTYGPVIEKKNK
ncbi:hypothetical protein H8356DRAFT_1081867 [Neocallimastix lanati (nom. inval.)]|nr:hypothetical protein H8356DRAFT_1081867 [Neocallimastix sp. JGI-2020a]